MDNQLTFPLRVWVVSERCILRLERPSEGPTLCNDYDTILARNKTRSYDFQYDSASSS